MSIYCELVSFAGVYDEFTGELQGLYSLIACLYFVEASLFDE